MKVKRKHIPWGEINIVLIKWLPIYAMIINQFYDLNYNK